MSEDLLAARWYDGRSAQGRAVRVRLTADGATVLDGEDPSVLARFALHDLETSAPAGATTRFLRLPDETHLEVEDGTALDNTLAACGRPVGLSRRLERRTRNILAAVLAGVLGAWLVYQWGIPTLARMTAEALPADTRSLLAGNALEQLDRYVFTPSQLPETQRARLAMLFGELVALADIAPPPRLELRGGGPLGANAFALPDGTVVATDELVALAADEDQLIAVLAHELGHVDHRHLLRAVLQNSAVALLGATLLGDLDSLGTLAGAVPTLLANAAYSRDFEHEADAYALELLGRADRPPQSLAAILDRVSSAAGESDSGGLSRYLQSHPPTRERLRALRDGEHE